MDFHAEPDFVHRAIEPRYFVRTLDERDAGYSRGNCWQIQLLNDSGEGAANIDFGPCDADQHFRLLAVAVPAPVIQAARRGANGYVDAHGNVCDLL